jgi:hypothetical protein
MLAPLLGGYLDTGYFHGKLLPIPSLSCIFAKTARRLYRVGDNASPALGSESKATLPRSHELVTGGYQNFVAMLMPG